MLKIHFITIIIPIFLIFVVGYIIGKIAKLDIRSLSYVAINVFYPFLAFHTFYENPITFDHIYIFISFGILIILLFICILIFARVSKASKKRKHAMYLSGVFMNGGNYGVPVVLFALGEEGFVYALMIMVVMGILMNSLGLFIAASGSNENVSKKQSLIKTLKMPIIPAIILGLSFQSMNIVLPSQLEDTIELLSGAAIPLIMIVLGIELSTIVIRKMEWKPVGFVVFARLILSPLLMLVIVHLLGLTNSILGSVLVLIAAMPSAANTTMFSVQFNVNPDFVSSTTLLSTILSLVTLPIWFMFI